MSGLDFASPLEVRVRYRGEAFMVRAGEGGELAHAVVAFLDAAPPALLDPEPRVGESPAYCGVAEFGMIVRRRDRRREPDEIVAIVELEPRDAERLYGREVAQTLTAILALLPDESARERNRREWGYWSSDARAALVLEE